MKEFNLKAKLLEAKDRATFVLAAGVLLADKAATDALEFASDVVEATKETAREVRREVGQKVDSTTATIKEKTGAAKDATAQKLGAFGDKIDEKAAKVSAATAEFGKAAKRTLNGKQEPQPVATPAVVAEEVPKAAAKKRSPRKPRAKTKAPGR